VKDLSAWYKVTQTDLSKAGGVGLVRHYYKQSLTRALIVRSSFKKRTRPQKF
jgi:hypothetical protein